ncbi:MAG: hypothetical protein KDA85_01400 [Planctomycetaceae bacterium]|nr:hypothetical protein [Planctomycetaceae bacterium]
MATLSIDPDRKETIMRGIPARYFAAQRALCGLVIGAGLLLACLPFPSAGVMADEQAEPSDPLFYFPPRTPVRLVEATEIAMGMEKPEAARSYLRRLLDISPTQQELQSLRRRFGISTFLKFNAVPLLQPEAHDLLMAINEASVTLAPSDAAMKDFVVQLGGDDRAATNAAMELLAARDRSVGFLLEADPSGLAGRRAQALLFRHARDLRHGIVEQLPQATPEQQLTLLTSLENCADEAVAVRLLRWQFSPDVTAETASAAQSTIDKLWKTGERPDSANAAAAWLMKQARADFAEAGHRFHSPENRLQQPRNDSDEERHSIITGALNLADDAVAIQSNDPQALSLQAALRLADGGVVFHADPTIAVDEIATELQNNVLRESLMASHAGASIGSLQALRRSVYENPDFPMDPQLLKQALEASDVRVRLLAADVLLAGTTPAWIAAIRQVIAGPAGGSLLPEAVIIDPFSQRRQELSSILTEAGYRVTADATSGDGFDSAAGQLACEMVMIHANAIRPDLSITVASLRRDARTRQTPILIFGPEETRNAATAISARYAGVWFVSEPLSRRLIRDQSSQLRQDDTLLPQLELYGFPRPWLSESDRQEIAELAERLRTKVERPAGYSLPLSSR